MKWFGDGLKNPQKTIKIYLNGKELETDEAAESYYSFAVAAPTPSASTGTLIIKPGIEITNDFFATNQIEITDTESGDTVSVGTYVEPRPNWVYTYTPTTGYCTETVMKWFGDGLKNPQKTVKIKLNGMELGTDETAESYYSFVVATPTPSASTGTLIIKPGKEITSDFFASNRIEIISTSDNETVTVGKYSGVIPDPEPEPLKESKTIKPAEDYRVLREYNDLYNLMLKVESDSDQIWSSKLIQVTYSIEGEDPVEMTIGTGSLGIGTDNSVQSINTGSGNVAAIWRANTIYIGVKQNVFSSVPVGETKEYTFTFKADGYEDSVVKQTVRNPKEVLEVAVDKGAKYGFALEDLQKMWKDEGSKEYTYSVYDTVPDVLEQEKHYGPTVKAVLAAAKIDLDSLADNDVVEFSTASSSALGYKARITAKDLKQKRYTFPNGASTNGFKGTTEKQLEGKSEVPYIISIKGGESDLRNVFGQIDPQDEAKYDWVQYLGKITVYKGTATTYDGLTPTLENGSSYKNGDKLNFDFDTAGWQAGATYAGIYYTVSTDGTEPADPTMSDIFYNFRQFGNPSYKNNPEYFNSYEFTNAEKTIVKVAAFIRGYAEPKVITLTYTHDHAAASPVKEKEVAATCTEAGSYEEVVYCSECGAEISRETKTVEALGHTEVAIGEAKAATCTEAGMTAGKKCSVCGEVFEEQKELPALGHDWEVIPEVISTCTKKGSTAGVRCTRCGEYMLEPHEVPMIYHDYQNGKCTVCGAEDPDYKPDEPTPIEPDTKFTGLANEADKDGVWWYYTDGKIDKTHTGVDQNKNGWWRVENGKVNFKAQSIYQNANGWWKTTDGKVTFDEQEIYQNEHGWWKTTDSKVTFKEFGVFQNVHGWWRVVDSKVDFSFTGIQSNQYGTWYLKDGKVDFNKNGKVKIDGVTYTIKNGKVVA